MCVSVLCLLLICFVCVEDSWGGVHCSIFISVLSFIVRFWGRIACGCTTCVTTLSGVPWADSGDDDDSIWTISMRSEIGDGLLGDVVSGESISESVNSHRGSFLSGSVNSCSIMSSIDGLVLPVVWCWNAWPRYECCCRCGG